MSGAPKNLPDNARADVVDKCIKLNKEAAELKEIEESLRAAIADANGVVMQLTAAVDGASLGLNMGTPGLAVGVNGNANGNANGTVDVANQMEKAVAHRDDLEEQLRLVTEHRMETEVSVARCQLLLEGDDDDDDDSDV